MPLFLSESMVIDMNKILETERLYLRRLHDDDSDRLYEMMRDPKTMYAYEHGFSKAETKEWLKRQLDRYAAYGFGLWAVILKESGELIGQCGITMQDYREHQVMEIGYVFDRHFWQNGYAGEAAYACREYGFEVLQADALYSMIRDNNLASICVAKHNQMRCVDTICKFYYHMNMPHYVYRITKQEWLSLKEKA